MNSCKVTLRMPFVVFGLCFFAQSVRAKWPDWVIKPGSQAVLRAAGGNYTFDDVVQQYIVFAPSATEVVANFENDTGACNILQPANGLWFGRQSTPYASCSIDKTFYQYAVFAVGGYAYLQPDNLGAFAVPNSAEKLCSYGLVDTPHDDQLVVAINGQVVYNKTGAGDGGPSETLVLSSKFTFPLDISSSTPGGQENQALIAMFSPNFPDPSHRRADAIFETAATLKDPSLAAPPANSSQEYPDYLVFQAYAGGHFVAVDLAKAPAHFNISSLFWQYNYDVADRATQDSCAACGICKNVNECPLKGKNFPNNPPDVCETSGTSNSTVDGSGPFTWKITTV